VLVLSGRASASWIEGLPSGSLGIAGIDGWRPEGLESIEGPLAGIIRRIESTVLHFSLDSSVIRRDQQDLLDPLISAIHELHSKAAAVGRYPVVLITGHTDRSGAESLNLNLSRARAANVEAALISGGVDLRILHIRGAGVSQPIRPEKTPADRAVNRRVSFKVQLMDSTPEAGS
jgi:outer membrane protein OmpA-like peptidoglycan-associated protein